MTANIQARLLLNAKTYLEKQKGTIQYELANEIFEAWKNSGDLGAKAKAGRVVTEYADITKREFSAIIDLFQKMRIVYETELAAQLEENDK